MPTYAIARQSLMRVAGLLTGRFDKDAHIVEHEALDGTPAGLTVNNPRGPNTPAIALLFQNDLLDKYETLTGVAQADFGTRCNSKVVGALLIYERIRAVDELKPQDTYVIQFGEELLRLI
ncbi:hypothetical protein [Paraburkholderia hospita]|uniref:Uncharacterized protein n=2 Tax=Paraburkholderia hospita TaxID=169430 RepID=A0AAJ4VVE0_9BURK|nr:hypothetical protein [Paraburkholderia hospita]SOE86094.1 hypothetical protein SAMN05446935_6593 [Burkholderia sp. YR290]AUT72349.1 hypothetical protein C2L64_29700 [Paraburkholderia hospita]AXF00783.1 hypothetical protein CUJ88_19825 [Paraburkholderia hospita]OUL75685.1 hypothetical protein CA602_35510 [Paraburkholderia hospita]OUL95125.1 hypothetical protein CA601_06465 [Paraburkholderia hospita]